MRENRHSEQTIRWLRKFRSLNWRFIAVITILAIIGFMMMYSAGLGNWEPWALRQIIRFAIAFPVMLIIALTDIRFWFRYSYLFYFLTIMLLAAVDIVGHIGMGAKRWLDLGPLNFQPSELAKIALVMVLARYFHNTLPEDQDRNKSLIIPLVLIVIPIVLILLQPNLGTAMIVALTGAGILFVTGVGIWKFLLAGGLGIAGAIAGWNSGLLHDYQKRRILTFLDPDTDPLGAGYNILQSKIAIGSGGFLGKGFLQGSQSQLSFLPEKQTDFIFTMLVEEFGFLGGFITIALYLTMIIMILKISLSTIHHFGRLLTAGIAIILFVHLLINVGMVMGLLPVVGLPLPLLSYGGSGLMVMMAAFGLVLNIHLNRDRHIIRQTIS